MYHLAHLLNLLTVERAKELHFRADSPPIMVFESERRLLQGPPISSEEMIRLLRSLVTSRQMRELRERGRLQFVYTLPDRSPFVIRAEMESNRIFLTIS